MASWINRIKAFPLNGFGRKPTAPAAMARRLTDSSGKAVMKIVGIRNPRHIWHLHIRNQTCGFGLSMRLEKFLRGRECVPVEAERLHKVLRCNANGRVVLPDRN